MNVRNPPLLSVITDLLSVDTLHIRTVWPEADENLKCLKLFLHAVQIFDYTIISPPPLPKRYTVPAAAQPRPLQLKLSKELKVCRDLCSVFTVFIQLFNDLFLEFSDKPVC